ncbi:hypothetical protein [Sphingomonas sp. DBB INV C78]|uniref:hypothetical protein n=1 Tax=Sphingomonas sp. DBB INV C78 TaxID=3349434 RepID=UPI0036D21EA5
MRTLPFTGSGAIANLGNDYAGIVWQSGVADAVAIVVDLGADVDLDTIGLFGIAGTLLSSASLRVSLATAAQGPAMNGSNVTTGTGTGNFWQPFTQALYAGSSMPVLGGGRSLWQKPAGGPPLFRYVNINVFGMGATNYVQMSRVAIGKRIQLDRNFVFGGAFGVRDLGNFDLSPRGVLIRRRSVKLRTAGVSFPHIHRDEVEAQVTPLLERLGNTEVVMLVTEPDAHAQRQNRMYLGPMVGDLSAVWAKADGFEWRCNLVSLF